MALNQFNMKNTYITKFMAVTNTLTQRTVQTIKMSIVMWILYIIALIFNVLFCLHMPIMYSIYGSFFAFAMMIMLGIYKCIRPNEISAMTRAINGDAYTGITVNEEKIESVVEKTYSIIGKLDLLNSFIALTTMLLILGEFIIILYRFIL